MRGKHSTIIGNAAALYTLQAINYLVPIFTFPYLIRIIGLDGFGRVTRVLAIVQVGVLFVNLAFNYTATARIARIRDNPEELSKVFWSVASVRGLLFLVTAPLLVILTFYIPNWDDDRSIFLALIPLLAGEMLFPMWLFMGLERLGFVTILNAVARVIAIGLLLLLVRTEQDITAAALVTAAPVFFTGLGSWTLLRRLGVSRRPQPDTTMMVETFAESLRAFGGTLPSHIYARGSMIILGALTSDLQFGLYAMAQRLAGLISSFVAPAAQSVYATICRAAEDDESYRKAREKTLAATLVGVLSAVLAVAVAAPWILELISGSPQPVGTVYLRMLLPVVLFSGISVMMNLFIMATQKFRRLFIVYVIASSVFILLAWPLTASFGVTGMIVTMVIVEGIVALGLVFISSHLSKSS
jgi:PST family polysaccharide transporter